MNNHSQYIDELEQIYCSSRSAAVVSSCCVVSSHGLGARMVSRIYNGGRKAVYMATVGAMLINNAMPVYGYYGANTSVRLVTVSSGQISSGLYAVGSPAVSCYGDIIVSGGGVTSNTIIDSLGREILVSGAKTYSTIANYWGTQLVSSGGVTYNTQVIDGGYQVLYNGGVARNTSLRAGSGGRQGMQIISLAGHAVSTVMYDGGWQYVSFGGKATDATIFSGGAQFVLDHGISFNTIISSGGELRVVAGGSALNVQQMEGGNIVTNIAREGNYISGINQNGDSFWVKNTSGYNIIMNRGANIVMQGGVVSNTIMNGGLLWVESGAVASSSILNGGVQSIISSGIARNTIINSGGSQTVSNGGLAQDTTINEGGSQSVLEGGKALHTQLDGRGNGEARQNVYGGFVDYTQLGQAGFQTLVAASADHTTINSGGGQIVGADAVALNTVINNGGFQYIPATGTASDTIVNSGGSQIITKLGEAHSTVVSSGGLQKVLSGGTAYNASVLSGGTQWVLESGVAAYTDIDGGVQSVVGSSHIIFPESSALYTSATVSETKVHNQGQQHLSSGGVAIKTSVYDGGIQYIHSSGIASGTQVGNGGSQVISSGGVANDAIISSAGSQIVENGGTANRTTLLPGGEQHVSSGGMVNDTVISEGGLQFIADGGIVDGAVIYNSGAQHISSGGTISSAVISGGGSMVVDDGGLADDTTIESGGKQDISSGGIASNTTVNFGGSQTVSNGGLAQDTTINEGGSQSVLEGGKASNTEINGGVQDISGEAASTIINNGGVQNIFSGGIASDTDIHDGTQNVFDGGTTSNTSINENSVQNISSGGAASSTDIQGGTQNVLAGGSSIDTTMSSGTVNLYEGGSISGFNAHGGLLNVYGDNTLAGNTVLTNGAAVNIVHSSGMTNLSMQHLTAHNAAFNMNVDLEHQTADKLSISDSYEGNALLKLKNVAAPIAKETTEDGIKLVEFGSSASVNGTFDLVGGQWDEGGYVYKLAQGTQANEGKDYYLRSTKLLTDTFKTMLNLPVMNVMIAQMGMNSLQKRMGELHHMDNANQKQGVWVRSYYKDLTVKDLLDTDMSLFGAEAGYDWFFRADEPTKLYAGVMLGFVQATDIKTATDQNAYAKGDGVSPSVGVYATLVNDDRWFVDIAARNFWTKLDMTNYSASGTALKYEPERNVLAFSAEVGKSFINQTERNKFVRIEPKAEVSYMSAASGSAEVTNGVGKLSYDSANYVNTKAGVLLSYNALRSNGLLIEPLLELSYRYEFLGEGDVSYGGAKEPSSLKGGTVEANIGLNMQLTDNLYWYSLGSYEAGEKVKGWGVYAGIRYAFGNSSSDKELKSVSNKAKARSHKNTSKKRTKIKKSSIKKSGTTQTSLLEQIENQSYGKK